MLRPGYLDGPYSAGHEFRQDLASSSRIDATSCELLVLLVKLLRTMSLTVPDVLGIACALRHGASWSRCILLDNDGGYREYKLMGNRIASRWSKQDGEVQEQQDGTDQRVLRQASATTGMTWGTVEIAMHWTRWKQSIECTNSLEVILPYHKRQAK